jgi:AraC-like DNA-binding protein
MVAVQVAERQSRSLAVAGLPDIRPSPLVKRFSTTDPEQARENVQVCHPWIRDYVPLITGQRFQHSRTQIALDRVMLTRSVFSHVRLTAENDDRLVLVLAERGWRSVHGRGTPVVSTDGTSAVLMPRGRVIYENGPDSTGFVVSVPVSDLAQSLELPFGRHDTQPRRIDLSTQIASQFRATLDFVFSQLSDLRTSCTPTLAAAYREVLLAGLAAMISPSAARVAERNVGEQLVRRACELIREGASNPLRLSDVATALGVSLRHLQAGFRNHLGTTPKNFLQDCRLERAHRMLSFALRGETTATIARASGFGHPGEFAAHYRQRYGECPSDTLNRYRAQFR